MWRFLWIPILLGMTAGCGGPGPLRVAVVTDPQQGPLSEAFLRGVQYAFKGAQNPSLELQTLSPKELPAHLEKVTVVIAGPMDLPDLRALLTLCESQHRPVIVAANHTLNLAKYPRVWRIPLNSDYLANAAAFFALKMLKKQRFAALCDTTDPEASALLADLRRYLQVYRASGPLRVLTPADTSMPRLRRWLRKNRPEVIFFVSSPGFSPDLSSLWQAGFRGAVIGFHEWTPEAPQKGEVYMVTDFCAADPEAQDFVQRYTQTMGVVPGLCDALGHDALQVVLAVAQRLETPSPEVFAARMRTVRVQGATGVLEFGTSHDPLGKRPLIVQYTAEGRRVVARPAVSPYR